MKKKLVFLMVFCVLIATFTGCGSVSDAGFRDMKWGMSSEEVIKAEEKKDDSSKALPYQNLCIVNEADTFGIDSYITYGFGNNDELSSAEIKFEPKEENFQKLKEMMDNDYGEPEKESSSDEGEYYVYNKEETRAELVFTDDESTGKVLKITFRHVE